MFSVIVRGTALGKNDEDLEAATRFDDGPDGGDKDEKFEIGGNLDQSDDMDDFLQGGGGQKEQANDQD